MQNIGFRLFKCKNTKTILMENCKSWLNNLNLNNKIKEEIKPRFNNNKILMYLQNIIDFINENNSIFESNFIKNTSIDTNEFYKYVNLKTVKKKYSCIGRILLIENLVNDKLEKYDVCTDSITDSIINSPFYDLTNNYIFQNYNLIDKNLNLSYNYFNKLVKKILKNINNNIPFIEKEQINYDMDKLKELEKELDIMYNILINYMFILTLLDLKNKDNIYLNSLKKLIKNFKSIEKEFYNQIIVIIQIIKKIDELNKKILIDLKNSG